ncbi:MAG: radical SAM protein [Verrucomicrobiales bacterium]
MNRRPPLRPRAAASSPHASLRIAPVLSASAEYSLRSLPYPHQADLPRLGQPSSQTKFFADPSANLILTSPNQELGVSRWLQLYRGCELACPLCSSRWTYENLGLFSESDFSRRILVRTSAATQLEELMRDKNYRAQPLGIGLTFDPYQPAEHGFRVMRECLELLADARHAVVVFTRSTELLRDLDLYQKLAGHQSVWVQIAFTTMQPNQGQAWESQSSPIAERLKMMRTLVQAGVPVSVSLGPIVPGWNDEEIAELLAATAAHGASHASLNFFELNASSRARLLEWINRHAPSDCPSVLEWLHQKDRTQLLQSMTRKMPATLLEQQVQHLFAKECRRHYMRRGHLPLATEHFLVPRDAQLSLFG